MKESEIEFESYKKKLIKEIFVDTADEDYAVARWLFLNYLPRQFFWSASQALEKYLKAVLLLKGRSVKDYNHKLVDLYAEVMRHDNGAIPTKLVAPEQVKFFSDLSWGNLWGDSNTEKFICHINKNGDSSNRYDYFGIEQVFGDLYKLDQIVLALRNIFVESLGIDDFKTKTGDFTDSISNSFYENNFSFAPKGFQHQELGLKSTTTISSLRVLYKNDILNASGLRNWVENNIKINKTEIGKLRK